MKRITYLLFLLLITLNAKSQDFKPGGQTQNLTEQKNVMVDYSTGLFHYTVPVCNLKSGDYELPISLGYVGQGVKDSDSNGLLGYNWTLNTGGIVTRTMRGGFPDEDASYGYLRTANDPTPLQDDAKNISLRRRDGESDIFTAVFNGQKVSFIIRTDENGNIYAEPLEQTDVLIKCEATSSKITGWVITDNNGNQYIYRQIEMNKDLQYVDVSTSNSISQMSYNSAWHLTRILPYNGETIEFCYKGDVENSRYYSKGRINTQQIWNSYEMIYYYGKPVKEQPFDFKKYEAIIDYNISEARYRLERCSQVILLKEVDAQMYSIKNYGARFFQPLENPIVATNNRIIGLLSDIEDMTSASLELERALASLSNTCYRMATNASPIEISSHLEQAGAHLRSAANGVRNCLVEIRNISEKKISGGSRYNIVSPILSMIISPERIMKFTYIGETNHDLSKIDLYTQSETLLSSVRLTKYSTNLTKVSFSDKEGKETSNMKFDYYTYTDFPSLPNGVTSDSWGFCKAQNASGNEYKMLTALHSLKSITLADGGKIGIEYEKNKASSESDYGGIRLKSLIFNDRASNRNDTISYSYPQPGQSVYYSYSNTDGICYSGFCDMIMYNRVRLKGHSIINTGNNGLFYPYITENIHGKGMNTYRFETATPSSNTYTIYPFWTNGLLSEKAMYDVNGKLQQMTKYNYGTLSSYNKLLPQVSPSDYYMDGEALEIYYKSQTTDYIKGEELYLNNIKPRLFPENKVDFYYLGYGGKVVLKEEVEYRLNENTPYSRTEYNYNNPKSMFPNRITRSGSDGRTIAKVYKRVVDMADGVQPVIDKMKQSNLLSPVIKDRTICDGRLINETVWKYQESGNIIVPMEALLYIPETSINDVTTAQETELFTYGESNYTSVASYQYTRNRTSCLPIKESGRTEKKSYAYDDYGKLILKCDADIAGVEGGNYDNMGSHYKPDIDKSLSTFKGTYEYFKSALKSIAVNVTDERFLYFLESNAHNFVILLGEEMIKSNLDINEVQTYYDIISSDGNKILNEFKQEYTRLFQLYPKYDSNNWFVKALEDIITSYDEQLFFEYLYLKEYKIGAQNYSGCIVNLTSLPDIKRLKLYVLNGGNSTSVHITHIGGKTTSNVDSNNSSSLKVYDIDLSTYTNVTTVTVSSQGTFMVLVPEGASFKATPYNTDGTVYAKFDQSGNVEFYTHDSAGRVIQTKDQNGNILKEYQYNQIINP